MSIKAVMVVAVLLVSITSPFVCLGQEEIHQADNGITVSGLATSFADDKDRRVITTIGMMKNSSGACIEDIVVEVKYYDSKKNLVDVATQCLYGIVVPSGQEVAFRVREEADKQKEAYVTSTVRVISAEPKTRKQESQTKLSTWISFLLSWGPMLLLIAVWIVFMRRYSGKASPQQRTLALVEQQNGILSREVEILERLALAVEKMQVNDRKPNHADEG